MFFEQLDSEFDSATDTLCDTNLALNVSVFLVHLRRIQANSYRLLLRIFADRIIQKSNRDALANSKFL